MLPAFAQSGPFNAAQAYDQALRLHQQGLLNEAEPLYARVVQARPDHVDALHMLGMIKLSKGQPVEARCDQDPRPFVLELGAPLSEGLGLLEFHHGEIVVRKLQKIRRAFRPVPPELAVHWFRTKRQCP